ncbi:restriction endonuclease subunit S [Bifidobacterium mongoliense]|uniref:restriction endonuclease subunit S n=1 Tax=Bifidobacterium mongoliense TaxID=518643 RepID=UPI0030ED2083
MSLLYDTLDFQPMSILDVFDTMTASKAWYDRVHLAQGPGQHLYLSQTQAANSIADIVADQSGPEERGNCITVTLKTQATFYQPAPFYTAQNFLIFRHERLDEASGLFLVTTMRQAMQKFSWGYGVSMNRLRQTHIMVPVIAESGGAIIPDWGGMTRLGTELLDQVVTHAHSAVQTDPTDDDTLPDLRFEPMFITDVFEEYRQAPAWLNTNQVVGGEGRWPHVTNTALGNSISGFIADQAVCPNPGNAITVGIDTQVVAYQPVPFYGATKVYQLRAETMNEHSAMLLVAALRDAIKKFSWGHKASAARLKKTRIMVPITTNEHGDTVVDWEGMAAYGRALRVRTERNLAPVLGV